MAKRATAAVQAWRRSNRKGTFSQGIGYHIPDDLSESQWKSLKQEWEDKLAKSGHIDIELFSPTGNFSPYFTKKSGYNSFSGSSATVSAYYNYATQEYYRLLSLYLHHGNIYKHFKPNGSLYRLLIKLSSEGKNYREVCEFLKSDKCPAKHRSNRSIFWAYYHTMKIEKRLREWVKKNAEWIYDNL
jgi:hypothetical protein